MTYPWSRKFFFKLTLTRKATGSTFVTFQYAHANTVTAAEDAIAKLVRSFHPGWDLLCMQVSEYEFECMARLHRQEVDA